MHLESSIISITKYMHFTSGHGTAPSCSGKDKISQKRIQLLYSCWFIYLKANWLLIIQFSIYISIKGNWWELLLFSGSTSQAFWILKWYILPRGSGWPRRCHNMLQLLFSHTNLEQPEKLKETASSKLWKILIYLNI